MTSQHSSLKFSKWQTWEQLDKSKDINNPGVYSIAITNKDLVGKKFDFKDVVYIGMTNSRGGLKQRLNQFKNSLNGKRAHSGGTRTFKEVKIKYKNWSNHKLKLFIAIHCVGTCQVDKKERKPKDLRVMGECVFLEYEALARFKYYSLRKDKNKEYYFEPKYNKK